MKQNWLKAILPHLAAIGIFILLAAVYCAPALEGKIVNQSDMMNVEGMAKEAKDFYEKTGEHPLWTNSMFAGMPTYVVYTGPGANKVAYMNRVATLFLPAPINMLFMAMISMYLLLCILDFKYWIRIMGAIAFAFCSYNVVLINFGHVTKMWDIALMPAVLAGIILAFRGRYIIGAAVTALATAMLIYNNHLQMIYYTLIMVLCLAVGAFVHALQTKTLPQFFKASVVLVIAAVLASLPSMENLLITREYTDYTMRGGKSELTLDDTGKVQKKSTGLDIDYAFDWSYGTLESFTMLIPGFVGNSSGEKLNTGSHVYEQMVSLGAPPAQAEQMMEQMKFPMYYGAQARGTSGTVYVGAIICFLFVLSLLLVKSWHKWWLLVVTVIGFVLAWGKNFGIINNFLFYHLPLYNKFRAPAQALVLPSLTFVVLAAWALQEVASGKHTKQELLLKLKNAVYITGGLLLVVGVFGSMFLNFSGHSDASMLQYFAQMMGGEENAKLMIRALEKDRSSLLLKDSIRSLVFVAIAAGTIWAFITDKLKWQTAAIIITVAVTIDLVQVDKNYLNNESFVEETTFMTQLAPSQADLQIKQDPDPYYRVFNVTTSPFDDATPSYFHKNIGGYSPAKLWIYQDLITHQIAKNNMKVLNMLNTKYFIVPDQQSRQPVAQRNPDAYGNAWFVKGIQWAPDANTEMKTLDYMNTRDSAVIDKRFQAQLSNFTPVADSAANIKLTQYSLNSLQYASNNTHDGLGVFSEIYYPAGWSAYIDGKPADIIRADYALRAIKIPAGQHKIDMKFEPKTFFLGMKISGISSTLLLILVAVALIWEIIAQRKKAA
ncbi:YfhO family protein [Chitinophaga nivalis]|uniref:YfhO family protein n=1 Tax=Chitinophaga nivalis TaxID=2991709 RepID=A0ABT3INP6_9BACT|nr:YfhO family protein [Chitinophaga nivalis]MCW3464713.1 YfhO family protein [Chitinophaga nivalis]MCW3485596.1 YfhO family protein [Chitinophaga nivalis]